MEMNTKYRKCRQAPVNPKIPDILDRNKDKDGEPG